MDKLKIFATAASRFQIELVGAGLRQVFPDELAFAMAKAQLVGLRGCIDWGSVEFGRIEAAFSTIGFIVNSKPISFDLNA